MGTEFMGKVDEIIKEIGMSDPHIKGVVLSSIIDAIPVLYRTLDTSSNVLSDFTSRVVIAYSTLRNAVERIARGQKLDNMTLHMETELLILKPIKDKYVLVVRGDKQVNLGLLYLKIKKLTEELEKYIG